MFLAIYLCGQMEVPGHWSHLGQQRPEERGRMDAGPFNLPNGPLKCGNHIPQFPTACGHKHVFVMLCVFSHLAQDFLSGKTRGSSLARICQKDYATGETLSNSLGLCLHNISPRCFTEPLLAGTLLYHFHRARHHKPQTCLKILTALWSVFN